MSFLRTSSKITQKKQIWHDRQKMCWTVYVMYVMLDTRERERDVFVVLDKVLFTMASVP